MRLGLVKCHKTHYSHQLALFLDKHLWIVAKLWLISRVLKKLILTMFYCLLFAILKERIFKVLALWVHMDSVYSPLLSDPLFFSTHSPDYVLVDSCLLPGMESIL